MAMKLFNKTKDNVFHPISKKHFGSENLEKTLEDWLQANPHLLGDDIMLIGRQVRTVHGTIDLLALDSKGDTIVIELKRGRASREVVGQLNSYLTIAASWSEHDLVHNTTLVPYSRETNNLIKRFKEHFDCTDVPEFNSRQIGVVVAEEYEPDFVPQISGLRFDRRVLQFSNFVDHEGEEYLLINTLHDSTSECVPGKKDDASDGSEYSRVPEEIRTRFYRLVDAVHGLVKKEICAESDGWRVHKSKKFVQAVFSRWKKNYEGLSLYYEPETGRQYLATNCLPQHNRSLLAKFTDNKKEIEAALGKGIRWEMDTWNSISEYISNDPSEIAERVKVYAQTLKPYLDEILPKSGHSRTTGGMTSVQLKFWEGFYEFSKKAGTELRFPTLRAKGFMQITLDGQLLVGIASKTRIAVYLAVKGENREKIFKQLSSEKTIFDKEFGGPLEWKPLPRKKESQVLILFMHGELLDQSTWPETYKWMLKSMEKFKGMFGPRLQKMRLR